MKELKAERKAKKKKRRRESGSESPPRPRVAVKVERVSPASDSPEPRRRRSRSPAKRKNKSSVKRHKSSRNERNISESRSRSPPPMVIKMKQEREEHSYIKHEERQHRNGSEQEHRRDRHREESNRGRHPNQRHGGQERSRDQEAQNLQQQQEDREFYNERRRERRQRKEVNSNGDNQELEASAAATTATTTVKELPNFELSGALLEDTNTFRGVVIKYSEPPEARIPKKRWRLYPFKNDEILPVMYIHRQSAYLLGRQRRIADIPIDHPSCSKQHAVLQYRLVEYNRADGTTGRRVKPYIIDLGSGNGTYLNNQRIEPQRYYELKEKDVLKFGFSSREYVVLHESSDTSEVDKKPGEEEDDEGVDERTKS
ncbi:smad nuclear-interacting protein 1 [Microcaecilia unicolor]|uniref:Smad nuclear-interacting protein 1 n=1 Tax=Microcaecilia unicolor TaxID=1415580 RepID=A0A6P7ZB54_9AMPH|nr:smad nuclear-interacting protein 1 [Microcaecilia unicolor]